MPNGSMPVFHQHDHQYHHHHYSNPTLEALLREVDHKLGLILAHMEKIMPSVDETLELARSNRTRIGSIKSLLDGIKQQLADALAGVTLPPAVQAKVDAVFEELTGEAAAVDAVLNENVPPPNP